MYAKFDGVGNDDSSGDEVEIREVNVYRQRGEQLFSNGDVEAALELFVKSIRVSGPGRRSDEVVGHVGAAMCLIELQKWADVVEHCDAVLDASQGPACGQGSSATKYKSVALAKMGQVRRAVLLLDAQPEYRDDNEVQELRASMVEGAEDMKRANCKSLTSAQFKQLMLPNPSVPSSPTAPSQEDDLRLVRLLMKEGEKDEDKLKFKEALSMCTAPDVAQLPVWRTVWAELAIVGGKFVTKDPKEYLNMLEEALPLLTESLTLSTKPTVRQLSYVVLASSVLALGRTHAPQRSERYRLQALVAMDDFIERRADKSLLPRRADIRKALADLRRDAGDSCGYESWSYSAAQDMVQHGRLELARPTLLAVAEFWSDRLDDAAFDVEKLEQRWRDRLIQEENSFKWPAVVEDGLEGVASSVEKRDKDAKTFLHTALYGGPCPVGAADHDEPARAAWLAVARWGATAGKDDVERAVALYRAGLLARSTEDAVKHLDAAVSAMGASEVDSASETALHRGDMLYHLSLALLLSGRPADALISIDTALKVVRGVLPSQLVLDRERACLGQQAVIITASALQSAPDTTDLTQPVKVTTILAEMERLCPQGPAPEHEETHRAVMAETRDRIQKLVQARRSAQPTGPKLKPMTHVIEEPLPPLPKSYVARSEGESNTRSYMMIIPILITICLAFLVNLYFVKRH
jgi:hypothetical protein